MSLAGNALSELTSHPWKQISCGYFSYRTCYSTFSVPMFLSSKIAANLCLFWLYKFVGMWMGRGLEEVSPSRDAPKTTRHLSPDIIFQPYLYTELHVQEE